jgi:hypothetical protein
MLTPNQATFETTPLLGDSRPAGQSSSLMRKLRFSPETLLIPVALATSLAAGIPSTTFIDLLRKAICRFYNASHGDPSALQAGGPGSPELCDAPEIAQYFATVLAISGATGGIICVSILLSTATVAHRHSSDCWVWHIKSFFIPAWEETSLRTRTYCPDHGELHDTRVTVHAILAH